MVCMVKIIIVFPLLNFVNFKILWHPLCWYTVYLQLKMVCRQIIHPLIEPYFILTCKKVQRFILMSLEQYQPNSFFCTSHSLWSVIFCFLIFYLFDLLMKSMWCLSIVFYRLKSLSRIMPNLNFYILKSCTILFLTHCSSTQHTLVRCNIL